MTEARTEDEKKLIPDTVTRAALDAYWGVGGSWSFSQVEKMRAALRAAAEVTR